MWLSGLNLLFSVSAFHMLLGTTERVCLIQGPLVGVRAMHNYIMDRILEKPEISTPAVTPGGHIALPSQISPPGVQPGSPESSPTTAALGGYTFWPVTAAATAIPAQPLFTTNRLLWERHKQVSPSSPFLLNFIPSLLLL